MDHRIPIRRILELVLDVERVDDGRKPANELEYINRCLVLSRTRRPVVLGLEIIEFLGDHGGDPALCSLHAAPQRVRGGNMERVPAVPRTTDRTNAV